jgi:hypothetical protein
LVAIVVVVLSIRTNKIATLEVETVQFVAGLLCIHDIFIHDERRAFCVIGNALANLAMYSSVYGHTTIMETLDVPDRAKLPKEVEQFLRGYVVANDIVSPPSILKAMLCSKDHGK